MAIVTSIIGKSGMGKSRSIRTIKNIDEVMIIRPSKKPFPWKKSWLDLKPWDKDTASGHYFYTNKSDAAIAVMKKMEQVGKKIIIIEDSTFFMTDFFMETAHEKGYDKFTNNAVSYYNILKAAENLDEDIRVYLINHVEEDANGFTKVKTIGKMLDEKIDIPSLLTIMLEAKLIDGAEVFQTNKKSSMDLSKSPEEMFGEMYIPNDLQAVDDKIKDYYGIED